MHEDDLVAAAVAGDAAALSRLLRAAAPQLAADVRVPVRWQSVLSVEDILQVTFMEAFLRIESFVSKPGRGIQAWLRTIADNNLLDAIRGLERGKRPPPAIQQGGATDSIDGLLEVLGVTTTTPSRVAAGREMTTALHRAIGGLPDDYALVIRAYDLEGASITETARRAGRSSGAVHMLRARAHARLRELLEPPSDPIRDGA